MKLLGILLIMAAGLIITVMSFIKKEQEPENLEKEIEEGDFYLLNDLVDKIKSGDQQYTSLDLQLQASYPKRLEWLLNR